MKHQPKNFRKYTKSEPTFYSQNEPQSYSENKYFENKNNGPLKNHQKHTSLPCQRHPNKRRFVKFKSLQRTTSMG